MTTVRTWPPPASGVESQQPVSSPNPSRPVPVKSLSSHVMKMTELQPWFSAFWREGGMHGRLLLGIWKFADLQQHGSIHLSGRNWLCSQTSALCDDQDMLLFR